MEKNKTSNVKYLIKVANSDGALNSLAAPLSYWALSQNWRKRDEQRDRREKDLRDLELMKIEHPEKADEIQKVIDGHRERASKRKKRWYRTLKDTGIGSLVGTGLGALAGGLIGHSHGLDGWQTAGASAVGGLGGAALGATAGNALSNMLRERDDFEY